MTLAWPAWFHQASPRSRCPQAKRVRLNLEKLEDRCVPAAVAQNDRFLTILDHALEIKQAQLLANDSGNALTTQIASQPANGSVLQLQDGGFLYIPRTGFIGVDTFTYQAVEAGVPSAPAIVTMDVLAEEPGGNQTPTTPPGGNQTTNTPGGTSTTQSANIRIVRGPTLAATADARFKGTVASIRSSASARSSQALINWGDGTTTRGTIIAVRGQLRVLGNHVYKDGGSYRVLVTIQTAPGELTQAQGRAIVAGAPAAKTPPQARNLRFGTLSAPAGKPIQKEIAHFSGAGSFRVLIDWGDSRATAGKIVRGKGGTLRVIGSHTYPRPGVYPLEITVLSPGGTVLRASAIARITSA